MTLGLVKCTKYLNSLCTDSQALQTAEYCIVGIPYNTAFWLFLFTYSSGFVERDLY